MKKLTGKQRLRELEAIAAIPDGRIDTSDIPELTEEQLRRAIRGRMYRPIKRPVTMRLDADVIEWLKEGGPGYQTKANALLRREMIHCYRAKKGPGRSNGTTARAGRARGSRGRR
jgi:uncharacterized protein (DUF4415 family)